MACIPSRTVLLSIILYLFAVRACAEKAQALFVFGDSYADTGNRNPFNQSENQPWRRPYGFSWPGFPAGRFSSGKIQTDFWAEILGLPSPIAYELLRSHGCHKDATKISSGVNFAVGGSGIFHSFGFTPVPYQVEQFKKLIAGSREFDPQKLSRSIVLISVVGNDYLSFAKRTNGSIKGLEDLVKPVVSGIVDVVKNLYRSGLRNFAVSNMGAIRCGPGIDRTSFDSIYCHIAVLHGKLLRDGVHRLRSDLEGLSIIIAELSSAFNHVFSNPTHYDFEDVFLPCCVGKEGKGKCAEVDERGRALFEVCDNIKKKFFWDPVHLTERGWYTLMSLYSYGAEIAGEERKLSFIEGASNVMEWVEHLGFVARDISFQSANSEV
uniref:TSA: Wollemia nobilis Ref_Wollemi_Transcript_3968_1463 transcribed RNA sequence n=1 Tax=Wollemia nobilis TaxID=56998 RepID=A0A0C9QWL3_9CONI